MACIASLVVGVAEAVAHPQPVTVVIVRHPESSPESPTFPLTAVGHQRAELLVQAVTCQGPTPAPASPSWAFVVVGQCSMIDLPGGTVF